MLDTNHFRVVAEGAAAADALDQRARKQRAEIFLSIITVQEAPGGWLGLINGITAGRAQVRAYASFQKTIAAFEKFDILPFDDDAAERFHALKKAFPNAGTMDLKIAAICLAHDMTLLTRDVGGFKDIPGLRVEDWLD